MYSGKNKNKNKNPFTHLHIPIEGHRSSGVVEESHGVRDFGLIRHNHVSQAHYTNRTLNFSFNTLHISRYLIKLPSSSLFIVPALMEEDIDPMFEAAQDDRSSVVLALGEVGCKL